MDPRTGFCGRGDLGQFGFRASQPSVAPGRLRIPPRFQRPLPIQPGQPFTQTAVQQYAVQVYVLVPPGGFSSFNPPAAQWRQIDNRTFAIVRTPGANALNPIFAAQTRFEALCRTYAVENQIKKAGGGRSSSVYRDPTIGYDYQSSGGLRTIVRMFSSRDNFATSTVVRECDVPRWQDT